MDHLGLRLVQGPEVGSQQRGLLHHKIPPLLFPRRPLQLLRQRLLPLQEGPLQREVEDPLLRPQGEVLDLLQEREHQHLRTRIRHLRRQEAHLQLLRGLPLVETPEVLLQDVDVDGVLHLRLLPRPLRNQRRQTSLLKRQQNLRVQGRLRLKVMSQRSP